MSSVFFSYSHVDEGLRDQLEKCLTMLKRQGVIDTWHDRRILAGDELDGSISAAESGVTWHLVFDEGGALIPGVHNSIGLADEAAEKHRQQRSAVQSSGFRG